MTKVRQGLVRTQPAAAAALAFGPLALNERDRHPEDDHAVDLSHFMILVGADRVGTHGPISPASSHASCRAVSRS